MGEKREIRGGHIERLIKISEFMEMLGIKGRSTFLIWERTREGFPKRITLSRSTVRFISSEAHRWVREQREKEDEDHG